MNIRYDFKDESLFKLAMTHVSLANDTKTESNQRLEFLGPPRKNGTTEPIRTTETLGTSGTNETMGHLGHQTHHPQHALGINGEGRGFFVMKRAKTYKVLASALKAYAGGNDGFDIHLILQFLNKPFVYPHKASSFREYL